MCYFIGPIHSRSISLYLWKQHPYWSFCVNYIFEMNQMPLRMLFVFDTFYSNRRTIKISKWISRWATTVCCSLIFKQKTQNLFRIIHHLNRNRSSDFDQCDHIDLLRINHFIACFFSFFCFFYYYYYYLSFYCSLLGAKYSHIWCVNRTHSELQ